MCGGIGFQAVVGVPVVVAAVAVGIQLLLLLLLLLHHNAAQLSGEATTAIATLLQPRQSKLQGFGVGAAGAAAMLDCGEANVAAATLQSRRDQNGILDCGEAKVAAAAPTPT